MCSKGHVMQLLTYNPYLDEDITEVICDKCNTDIIVAEGFNHCEACAKDVKEENPCDYHKHCVPQFG
jgi:hypothetical protein